MNNEAFLAKKEVLQKELCVPSGFSSKSGEEFIFKLINQVPSEALLVVRNSPNVLKNMRNKNPISADDHKAFINAYNTFQRIDFICLDKTNGYVVGGISVVKTQYGYEMGKYIGNEQYLGKGVAYPMAKSFLSFVKENLKEIDEVKAVIKITNFKNINLNFKLGFKIQKRVETNYWLMGY